jgi:hypothetical protein
MRYKNVRTRGFPPLDPTFLFVAFLGLVQLICFFPFTHPPPPPPVALKRDVFNPRFLLTRTFNNDPEKSYVSTPFPFSPKWLYPTCTPDSGPEKSRVSPPLPIGPDVTLLHPVLPVAASKRAVFHPHPTSYWPERDSTPFYTLCSLLFCSVLVCVHFRLKVQAEWPSQH